MPKIPTNQPTNHWTKSDAPVIYQAQFNLPQGRMY